MVAYIMDIVIKAGLALIVGLVIGYFLGKRSGLKEGIYRSLNEPGLDFQSMITRLWSSRKMRVIQIVVTHLSNNRMTWTVEAEIPYLKPTSRPLRKVLAKCILCDGTGQHKGGDCRACGGTGKFKSGIGAPDPNSNHVKWEEKTIAEDFPDPDINQYGDPWIVDEDQ